MLHDAAIDVAQRRCGYGSGYEPGSQWEWNPDCPAHPSHVTTADDRAAREALATTESGVGL